MMKYFQFARPESSRVMAAVSLMSSEAGLGTDFTQEDDGYFTCAVSVQHKVSVSTGSTGVHGYRRTWVQEYMGTGVNRYRI